MQDIGAVHSSHTVVTQTEYLIMLGDRFFGFFFTLFVDCFVGLLKPVLLQTQYESLFQSAVVRHCYLSSTAVQFCFRVAQLV